MVTGVEDDKWHHPPNETSGGHQTDIYSSQSELSDDTSVLAVRESRWRQRDTVYGRRLFRNDEHMRRAEDPSGMDEEQGTGDRQVLRQVKHLGRYRGAVLGHQTDISSSQVQLAIKANAPGHGETRRRHEDAVYNKRSFTNDNSMRQTGGTAAVKERQGTGNIPDPQLPMRSRTHETSYDGLQTAMPLFQGQPPTQVRNSGYGVYNRCSITNDEYKEKLTKLSVRLQERSTTLYSLARRPKAPDKRVRQVDDRPPRVTENSRQHCDGVIVRKRSYTNVEPTVSNDENSRLSGIVVNKQWTAYITPSLTNRSGGTLVTQGSTRSRMRNGYLYDPQTAVPSSQPQPSRGLSNPRYGESRGHPGDAQYGERTRINNENSRIPKEAVNGRRTVCCTPSLTNETGYLPVSQRPTRSKTRNKYPYNPQMAVDPHHRETTSNLCIQRIEGSRGGSCTQRGGGVGNGICLNSNVKHEKKLTSLSVSVQEQSTVMYSPGRKPKAPDKHAWCGDNKYKPEAHNAPRPTERDCVEQSLKQQDVSGRQWSWCDSCHTSHDTTREHVVEGGEMECAHPTHPTHQAHGPYWDQGQ
jgi:hypothetical protein